MLRGPGPCQWRRRARAVPKTVRNAHGVIRTGLRDTVRRGYVPRNVAEDARLPRVERRELRTWSAGELRTFLAHLEGDRLYAMWLLYATTGLRRGEVLGLRWRDVDLEAGKVSISHVLTVVNGKAVSTEPKTAKGRRTIAHDGATVTALRKHRTAEVAGRQGIEP